MKMAKHSAFAICLMLSVLSGTVQARTNFIEVFSKSNARQCIEAQFEGMALYVSVGFTGATFFT